MNENACDLAIIGGGPGGYVAAIYAAHRGLKVALVEAGAVGGVCLHTGCIPTKVMLASLDVLRQARAAEALGVATGSVEASLAKIVARRQKVVQQLAQGVRFLVEKNQVELIRGRGALTSPNTVEVRDAQGQTVRTLVQPRAIVLATGSRPTELPMAARDRTHVLNSDDALQLTEVPRDLVIIGGGYIGCEFACVFAPLGSRVTVLEGLSRLLPNLDQELGQALERSFAKAGIQVRLDAQVEQVEPGDEVLVRLAGGETISAAKALVAVGRTPNLENLGLEQAGVQYDRRGIRVNEFLQTSAPHIYAIGDVTGKIALAHVASAQGRCVVDHFLAQSTSGTAAAGSRGDGPTPLNEDAVPACVFTHPEIATVGLSEDEAARRGLNVRVSRFPLAAAGKSQATGETEGFVKLVAEAATGRLVGGHILGGHAAEMIATVTLAVQWGLTARQITHTIFAHPTLSEAILEAAEGVEGKPIHIVTRR